MTSASAPLHELTVALGQLAEAVEHRQEDTVARHLQATPTLCRALAPQQPQDRQALLEDLAHRLEVWASVWPRLGQDPGFRQAVAREARLWATKLRGGTH